MMAVGGSEEEISSEEEDNQACLDNFAIESAKVALLKEQEPWLNTSYKVELQFEENSNDSMTWVTIQGKKVDRDHSKIYIKCLCNPNMTFRMNYPLEMRATLTDHDLHATFEKRYGVAILFKDDGTAIIQDADNVSFALALSAIEDFIGSGETVEDPSHPSTGSKLLAEQLERMASQDESVIVDDNFQQQPNAVKRSMLDFCKDHDSSVIMLEDSDKADEPSTSTQVQGKRKKKKKKKKKKNPVHSGSDSEVITDLEDHMKKDLLHSKTNLKIEISQKGKSRKVCETMDPNFLEIAKDKGYTTDEISAIVENYGCDLPPSEFFHKLLDMRLAKESASTDSDSVAKTPAVVVLGSKHKKVVDILSEDDEDIPILHPVQEMFSGSSSCGSPVLKHRRVHSPAKAETATKSLPDLAPEYWEKLSDHMEREDDSCIKQLKKNNEERRIALQSVRPDVEMKANNVDTGMEHISQDKNNCKLGGDPAAHSAERSSSKKRSISSGRTSPKPPASANKGGNKSHSKPSPAEASTSATVRSVNGSNKTCNNKDNGPKKSSSDSKKSSSSSAKHKTVTTNMAAPHPQYQPTNMSAGPSSLPSVMGAEAPVFPSSDAVNDFICVDDNVPSDSMIDNVLVNVVNQPATATAGARQYGEHVSPLMALEESSTSQAASTSNNKRYIVIDGSNVAMCHGNQKIFSCKGIELCINYFKSCGHKEITAFVPQWRQRTIQNDRIPIRDQHILEELRESGNLVYTPARRVPGKNIVCYDDKFVLRLAEQTDGIIVSNDNYRDLWEEKREWRHIIETRLLMFSFVGDLFMPPDDPLGRNGPSLDHLLHKHPEDQPGYNNWQRSRTNYNRGGSGARPKHPQNKSKFPIGVWNEPTNISHRNPHSKPVKDNYKVGYMGPIGRGRGGRGTSNYESYAGQIGSMAGPSTTQHGHNFTSPPDYWAPNAPNKKPAPLSQHQPHNNSPHGGESQSKGSTGPARRSSLETDELFKVLFETFPQRTTAIDSILKKYPCVRDIDRLSGYLLDSL